MVPFPKDIQPPLQPIPAHAPLPNPPDLLHAHGRRPPADPAVSLADTLPLERIELHEFECTAPGNQLLPVPIRHDSLLGLHTLCDSLCEHAFWAGGGGDVG